jgi:hypothetical protein
MMFIFWFQNVSALYYALIECARIFSRGMAIMQEVEVLGVKLSFKN